MKQQTSIPKGTKDFSPQEMAKRNYIFNTIRQIFTLYGFQQIETPAMENLSTLLNKYGNEGDKLLFKVLNSGDFLKNVDITEANTSKLATTLCKKGLRYDLTVPFARYVTQHQNDIVFPFKRYQIQPVWRADRPQKGRYREFYQCDADIIGSSSLLNEVELTQIIDEVFQKLGINVIIKLNNRKILSAITEVIEESDKITDITVAIDKLDKIGKESVIKELIGKGVKPNAVKKLEPIIELKGSNYEKLTYIEKMVSKTEIGRKGVEELQILLNHIERSNLTAKVEFDLTLARGLNYYTGTIYEVKAQDTEIGSITGGGRYDDLTGSFGLKNMSGVGISFGADRIYDVMHSLDLFPKKLTEFTKLLFINFGGEEEKHCIALAKRIRQQGIKTELYPDSAKMKKQMTYADRKKIPYVAVIGSQEIAENTITLKDMNTGEQVKITENTLIKKLIQ